MKAFFEVHLRLVITVWVILLSVLGLLYLMNYMKFDNLMSQVVSSKLQVISTSLESSIQRTERWVFHFILPTISKQVLTKPAQGKKTLRL